MSLYPLKFETIFKDKIWGGRKIKDVLHKDFSPLPNCGETWEISGVSSDVSVVANGILKGQKLSDILAEEKENLVGKKNYQTYGNEFPLLVKFIDANDDLSIQVHPNDELAEKRHHSKGKTEMWYVLQADSGSTLISGFNQPVDRAKYLEKFESGQLMEILNKEEVSAGDIFFLPAGRIHTIGKGLLIAEIQQTSDITYRIYDFDRVDDKGNKRELHVKEALDAIDFNFYNQYKTDYKKAKNEAIEAVKCPFFTTNVLDYNESTNRDYSQLDSFVIHVCVEGSYSLGYDGGELAVKKGDCILVPASEKEIQLETSEGFKILESYIA
ncbi:mannose-6-phosphate isomerase, type 1 [Pseudopedobacter saltans DSM 12145]|uniref:Phosphohexomutase n=1 Tax=Pseudopedobacter saltans (strain ATCC 51119 / DSM 12145 / JCM 21818 / CCUG 39354 / LMG 10337 / NBRC 100064 / NCIMB 13643) TaxID=762903 RepID=F0SD61_PSESL|nr:type I phosphomannose isomerase catalytic subunit [Pseudopedobacter saltans]ADY52847.1 mannose-6-phosphate isomerase, type 1 [Pseudopedobacter saltans DSM 12145]